MTPFGVLERSAAKGTVMGNRGDLHGRDGEIVRPWRGRRWICCATVGKDGHRVVFDRPGRYTPLFALDEATMLAAGHRPCGQCRSEAFARFQAAWARANTTPDGCMPPADAVDIALHAVRLDAEGYQRSYRARIDELPDGVMVATSALEDTGPRAAWLLWNGHAHPWHHDGYGRREPIQGAAIVDVLTPVSTVAVLRAGYQPEVAL